jgi:polyhydroxyalkanoate synthesis regulator protein
MQAPMPTATKPPSILVKRYASSRLYDTTSRRYVALAQLRNWAADGIAYAVIDAATGADITRVLLA